jgi:hypothetical protein
MLQDSELINSSLAGNTPRIKPVIIMAGDGNLVSGFGLLLPTAFLQSRQGISAS